MSFPKCNSVENEKKYTTEACEDLPNYCKGKSKVIPLQTRCGPDGG